MTAIINASNTSGITFTSDTSGNLALQSNGTTVVTISGTGANAGIQMGSAFAPAFSAYLATDQSVSNNTWTKVTINTEEFDTANCFDSSTNYRFTPTVAGYYQINASVRFSGGAYNNQVQASIYKNGSAFKNATMSTNSGVGTILNQPSLTISAVIYFNGTTDYVELYGNNTNGTSPVFFGGQAQTYFSGALVRSA